ncbi:type IV secretion system protein [Frigoribacterium sp. CFBP 8754]|uniref:type IV secretion system protein n=1 Tax=Frigoribacterium sp. CFBP 8754 TaxID=2775290 RepID=UPI001FCE6626|nr:type IV secretion system protein [Frigoribacterium sp. CFBP 8754]
MAWDCSNAAYVATHIQECAAEGASAVVSKAANDTVQQLMNNALETFGKIVGSLGTLWVNVPSPELTRGDADASGYTPTETVTSSFDTILGYVAWIGLLVAVLSIIGFAIMFMRARSEETGLDSLGRLGLIFGGVFLVTSASSLVAWLIPTTAPSGSSTTVGFLQSSTWYIVLTMAVASVIIAGIRIAWTQRGEPVRDLLKSMLTLIMVSTIGLTVIQLAVSAGDAFSVGILNAATDCNVAADTGTSSCFGTNVYGMIGLAASSPIGTIGVLILALIAILMTFVQVALMVVRSAMLVLLAGVLPLTASFTNTPTGEQWFRKSLGWLIAFILYKPAAALIYAAAFRLVGTDLFAKDDGGVWSIMTGLALMVIALVALPALMRFIAPMVAPAGGGAAGAAIAGGIGAIAGQGASGAVRKLGSSASRTASEGGGGGGEGSSASGSTSTGARSAGGTGASKGGAAGAKAGATGAQSGAAAQTAGAGAASGAGAGAGAAASAGGGAAAGGAAAGASGAAAAAGPAGIAVIGAQKVAEGAKKVADGVKSAAEDSAGEGPSGSK